MLRHIIQLGSAFKNILVQKYSLRPEHLCHNIFCLRCIRLSYNAVFTQKTIQFSRNKFQQISCGVQETCKTYFNRSRALIYKQKLNPKIRKRRLCDTFLVNKIIEYIITKTYPRKCLYLMLRYATGQFSFNVTTFNSKKYNRCEDSITIALL